MKTKDMLWNASVKRQLFTIDDNELDRIVVNVAPHSYSLIGISTFNRWSDLSCDGLHALLLKKGYVFSGPEVGYTIKGKPAPRFDEVYRKVVVHNETVPPPVESGPYTWNAQPRHDEPVYAPAYQDDTPPSRDNLGRFNGARLAMRNERGQFLPTRNVAHFIYTKEDGSVSSRRVVSTEPNPTYLKGYDLDAHGFRTFRRDRMDWVSYRREYVDMPREYINASR